MYSWCVLIYTYKNKNKIYHNYFVKFSSDSSKFWYKNIIYTRVFCDVYDGIISRAYYYNINIVLYTRETCSDLLEIFKRFGCGGKTSGIYADPYILFLLLPGPTVLSRPITTTTTTTMAAAECIINLEPDGPAITRADTTAAVAEGGPQKQPQPPVNNELPVLSASIRKLVNLYYSLPPPKPYISPHTRILNG